MLQGDIVVRRAPRGEKLTTLDGVVRTLAADDLLITDDRGPIGLAGVMGGADVELAETTTDIVIEAAHFDPATIARTSRLHKLPSEASKRYERGVDPSCRPAPTQRVARAARRARRRHHRARPHRRRRAAGARRRSPSRTTSRPASPASTIDAATRPRRALAAGGGDVVHADGTHHR